MKFFFNGLIAAGILFGIIIVIIFEFVTDFFGNSFQPSGELMAALLGASIGWAGTVLTIHASIEGKKEEQLSRDQAVSSEIFVKFQKIVNNLYTFRKYLRESYDAVAPESHENPGLFVMAFSGHPDPVSFTSEEKALYIRLKKLDCANDLAIWDERHNSLVRALQKYADLRQSFMDGMPARMRGNIGTSEFTEEEFMRFAPKLAQLNSLAMQIRENCEDYYSRCREPVQRIKSEMENLCGIKLDVTFHE